MAVGHKREGLAQRQRLQDGASFQRVLRLGRRAEATLLTLVALRSCDKRARLGLAISRRVGGAVRRNRAKRLVREAFRRRRCSGYEFVVLAKPGLPDARLSVVAEQLGALIERLDAPAKGRRDKRATAAD